MRTVVINREELETVYKTMTSKEACKHYGVCVQTFYNMLDAAKIDRKRPDMKRGENIKYQVVN